jgi:hypothetical protein
MNVRPKFLYGAFVRPFILTGRMAGNPPRPVIEFEGQGKLTYRGPQAPDPRVETARALTGGVSSLAGIVIGGDVLKSLGRVPGLLVQLNVSTSDTNNTSVSDHSFISVSDTAVNDTCVTNEIMTAGER